MNNQNHIRIITSSRREFLNWAKENYTGFYSLQHIFPEKEIDIEITNIIFYKKESEIKKYYKDGVTDSIIDKFKEILQINGLPNRVIDAMIFEIDSDENISINYEGNYFSRINK
mgnify:CR=1 FL=1